MFTRTYGDQGLGLKILGAHSGALQRHSLDEATKRGRPAQVNDEVERGRLLDGQVSGLGALEDLVHIGRRAKEEIGKVR